MGISVNEEILNNNLKNLETNGNINTIHQNLMG